MDYAAAIAMMVGIVIVKIPHVRNPLSSRAGNRNILKSTLSLYHRGQEGVNPKVRF
jgi:hypothetical protein